jgi:hypothetical protein
MAQRLLFIRNYFQPVKSFSVVKRLNYWDASFLCFRFMPLLEFFVTGPTLPSPIGFDAPVKQFFG